MNPSDEKRLAQIRQKSELWIATDPEAKNWNDAFLLQIIDRLLDKKD
jgi:hypothetical protein